MGKTLILIFIAFLLMACSTEPDDFKLLTEYMTGSFSSAEQAQVDTNFLDIRLEMAHIWKDRTDGYWLYVEQAAASSLDKPYRQRIYQLTAHGDSAYQSTVYTFKDPQKYIGAWQDDAKLSGLTPDQLQERDGCAIVLKPYAPGVFVGSTESLRCDSNLRGASYATSIVLINKDQMYSWDRGFDLDGKQVWGAKTGGYIFKKVKK
jgi:hypothetical protein